MKRGLIFPLVALAVSCLPAAPEMDDVDVLQERFLKDRRPADRKAWYAACERAGVDVTKRKRSTIDVRGMGTSFPREGSLCFNVTHHVRGMEAGPYRGQPYPEKEIAAADNFLFGLRDGFRLLGFGREGAMKGGKVVLAGFDTHYPNGHTDHPAHFHIINDCRDGNQVSHFYMDPKSGRLTKDCFQDMNRPSDSWDRCYEHRLGDSWEMYDGYADVAFTVTLLKNGIGLEVATSNGAFRVTGERPCQSVRLSVKDGERWRVVKTIAVRDDPLKGEMLTPDGIVRYDPDTFDYRELKRATQLGRLTPPLPKAPRINTPAVLAVRPGHEIVYRLPVTGESPEVEVEGLGQGLALKGQVLRGRIAKAGDCPIRIRAKNAFGRDEKTMVVRVGEALALTPPMGWNSWNCFYGMVSDRNLRDAADRLVATGLADLGYQYVNMDAWWQINNNKQAKDHPEMHGKARDEQGRILSNAKFPDMKALTAYIHAKGLKCGIYSSPGPFSCGGCECSWKHEYQDAARFAEWGFDYLKYDWCSYANVVKGETATSETFALPYRLMAQALRLQDRDIVFAMSEYGMGSPWCWAKTTGAHLWRTTGDVNDSWERIATVMSVHRNIWMYNAPGAWNDPDMLVVKAEHGTCGLTPNEQHTHLAFWCLQAAPLLIGCDLTKIDDFTFGLIGNAELVAIDQDALGAAAACVSSNDVHEVWARPLADGDIAFGVFNPNEYDVKASVDLPRDLGMEGPWNVRDVWRQRDLGTVADKLSLDLPARMTYVYRARPAGGGRLTPTLTDMRNLSWQRVVERKRPLVPNDPAANSGPPGTVQPKGFKFSP